MNAPARNLNPGGASACRAEASERRLFPASCCKSFLSLTKRPGALARRVRVHSRVRSDQLPRKRKLLFPLLRLRVYAVHLRQQCSSQYARLRLEYLHRKVLFRIVETQPQTRSLQSMLHAKINRRSAIPKIQPILFRRRPFTLSFQKKSVRRPLNQYPHSFPPSARKTTSASYIAKYLFTAYVHDLSFIRAIRGKISVPSVLNSRLCS